LLSTPRTDPGGRDSRTGLPPRVVNDESHEQLRVHSRASGTRSAKSTSNPPKTQPIEDEDDDEYENEKTANRKR
jgi:hypothetical protein